MSKRIVIALGGNALGNTAAEQLQLVTETAKSIVDLIAAGNEVVVAHGNGPQVGMINLGLSTAAEAGAIKADMPFPECGAMSQGYIGYHLQNAIGNELASRGMAKDVATVVTQVLVDEADPAFQHPTKPVGAFYDKETADRIAAEKGYTMVEDAGRGYRQVVPSPKPIDVIEKNYGPDAAKMLGSMMFEGGDIIRERIQRYQIQCDYRPGGLFVAMNHKQLETLEEQKANWERYGNTQLELLDREAIRREVDSDRYVGALLDHSGGHIHPLNLAIGEADAIRLNGGRVYEQSPVTRIQHTSPAVVSTARGQVTARYVIVAGNAYLGDKLEPELAKRSMPCGTQVVTTAPLSEEVARSLIPKNYCVEDCNYLLDYYLSLIHI